MGVRWPVLCKLIQFIYIGEAVVGGHLLQEVLEAGQLLGITGLKDLKQASVQQVCFEIRFMHIF